MATDGDFKCPYCGVGTWVDGDSSLYEEGTHEYDCGQCEKKFRIEVTHSVDFDIMGSCKLNNEMPHQLKGKTFGTRSILYTCVKCKQEFYDWMLPGGAHPKLKEGDFFIDHQKDLGI